MFNNNIWHKCIIVICIGSSLSCKVYYGITAVLKVETDIVTSDNVCRILNVKTDDIVFICSFIMCLTNKFQYQNQLITNKVVSSNPIHGEVYSTQHYVIKFVSDLRQVDGFLQVLRFPPPIKLTAMI